MSTANLAKKNTTTPTARLEKQEKTKAYAALVGTLLAAIKLILAQFGIEIPQDMVDLGVNIILGMVTLWGWFRNNYITTRGIKQLHVLKNSKLH